MPHEFCDHCPGCRPALMDMQGRVMPQDSPVMVALNRVWNTQTTYAERKAFINVTVNNSREPEDLLLAQVILQKFQATGLS